MRKALLGPGMMIAVWLLALAGAGCVPSPTPATQALLVPTLPATPTQSAPPANTPVALPAHECRVKVAALTLRAGPGAHYPVLAQVAGGARFDGQQRSIDATWILGASPGASGWGAAAYLDCSYDLFGLPVAAALPPADTTVASSSLAPAPLPLPTLPPGAPTSPSHQVSVVGFNPPAPADLTFGQPVSVTFTYATTETGGVTIQLQPFAGGALAPNRATSDATLYLASQGRGSLTFTVTAGDVRLDQVRFQIWTPDQNALLAENFVPARYHFVAPAVGLSTPTQLAPPPDSLVGPYPHATTLRWSEVPGAARYAVQIDFLHYCQPGRWCTETATGNYGQVEAAGTQYTFDFGWAQPVRWRVWAIDAQGRPGPRSPWWEFRYTP
jgi:hypothetical protein